MNYRMENNSRFMQRRVVFLFFVFLLCLIHEGHAIPAKPEPARLVNDYALLLDADDRMRLESSLSQFARETSTQIVVVTISSLDGYAIGDYAVRLGHSWGVGQGDNDNGLVIVVKPRVGNERGEVFIATGYGLEGAVPDAIARRIVDNEIIPHFRNEDYYAGLLSGVNVIMELTRGEYTADEYVNRTGGEGSAVGAFFVLLFIMIIASLVLRTKKVKNSAIGRELPFWTIMSMLSASSHGHSGSWGNFSSGKGSFGGGGGFGGFGGGGFGGGGAGGSW